MGSSCILLYIYMYIQWIHINNNATETNVFTFKNSLRLECKYLISLFPPLRPSFTIYLLCAFSNSWPFFFISWWNYWWWWCLCVCVCIHKYISWASLVCIVLFILHNVFRSGHLDFLYPIVVLFLGRNLSCL